MGKISNRMQATLLKLTNDDGKQLLETLSNLSDLIENKSDPDQNELYILENLYKVQENLNLLVTNLKKHSRGLDVFHNSGSKLSELFEKNGTFN